MRYYRDRGQSYGIATELVRGLESYLQKRLPAAGRAGISVTVITIPSTREQIPTQLVSGQADLAIGDFAKSSPMRSFLAFSLPIVVDNPAIVVTRPGLREPDTLGDLSGLRIKVTEDSRAWRALQQVNRELLSRNQLPVDLRVMDPVLSDEDLLDMTRASLIDHTIVDRDVARFWKAVLPGLRVDDALEIAPPTDEAWLVRPDAPRLLAEVNAFLTTVRGTPQQGYAPLKRRLADLGWARPALQPPYRQRLSPLLPLFERHAGRYDLDPWLLAAIAFQESGLDHQVRSPYGTVGLMQILPSTGRTLKVGDIRQLEPNVHAAAKYLRQLMDDLGPIEGARDVDRVQLALASYNAGPNRLRRVRDQAEREGLDPNRWKGQVELVMGARHGQHTVGYVNNVTKVWLAYREAFAAPEGLAAP